MYLNCSLNFKTFSQEPAKVPNYLTHFRMGRTGKLHQLEDKIV